MTDNTAMADAANLLGETQDTKVNLRDGRVVTIHKCKARNVGIILDFVAFVMKSMGIDQLGEAPKVDTAQADFFLQLLSKAADRLFITCATLCDLTYEELADLELDEALLVVKAVYEVNLPFFSQSVLPQLRFALPALQAVNQAQVKEHAKTSVKPS